MWLEAWNTYESPSVSRESISQETKKELENFSQVSIVDYLKQEWQDSSYEARKKLAENYWIEWYKWSSKQNLQLLILLQKHEKHLKIKDSPTEFSTRKRSQEYNQSLHEVFNQQTFQAIMEVTQEKVLHLLPKDVLSQFDGQYSYEEYMNMTENQRFSAFSQKIEDGIYKFQISDKQVEQKCRLDEMIPSNIQAFYLINGGRNDIVYRNSSEENFQYLDKKGHPYVLNNTQIKLIWENELQTLLREKQSPLERYENMSIQERFETYTHQDENGYLEFSFPNKEVEYRAKLQEIVPKDIQVLILHEGWVHSLLHRWKQWQLQYENPYMNGKNPLVFNGTRIKIINEQDYQKIIEQREKIYDISLWLANFIDTYRLENFWWWNCGMNVRPVVEKYLWIDVPNWGMHWYRWERFLDELVESGLMMKEYVGNPQNAKPWALLCYRQMNTGSKNQTNREKYWHIEIKWLEKEATFYDQNWKPYTEFASHYYHGPYVKTPGGSIDARWQESWFTGYAYYPKKINNDLAMAQAITQWLRA